MLVSIMKKLRSWAIVIFWAQTMAKKRKMILMKMLSFNMLQWLISKSKTSTTSLKSLIRATRRSTSHLKVTTYLSTSMKRLIQKTALRLKLTESGNFSTTRLKMEKTFLHRTSETSIKTISRLGKVKLSSSNVQKPKLRKTLGAMEPTICRTRSVIVTCLRLKELLHWHLQMEY